MKRPSDQEYDQEDDQVNSIDNIDHDLIAMTCKSLEGLEFNEFKLNET